jgi:drug/metabolite transporter (DMT)-like permease
MTRMTSTRVVALNLLAMLAFAANSLLCRSALRSTSIDPATFTAIRLVSGACVLAVIVAIRGRARLGGNWWSALALFIYAAGFSLAYVGLPAAAGALLLFGSVQVTMHAWGIRAGERIDRWQACGLLLAAGGLVALLLPGLSTPPPGSAALMLSAGIAWGVYSLRGQGAGDPTATTAGNFLRSVPMVALLVLMLPGPRDLDGTGLALAVASGALASGVGYAIWYAALPSLKATTASVVQLSVPVIAAIGGVVLLAEPVSLRLVLSALAVLGGVALALRRSVRVPTGS